MLLHLCAQFYCHYFIYVHGYIDVITSMCTVLLMLLHLCAQFCGYYYIYVHNLIDVIKL